MSFEEELERPPPRKQPEQQADTEAGFTDEGEGEADTDSVPETGDEEAGPEVSTLVSQF